MGIFSNQYVIFALFSVVIFSVYMGVVALLRKDPVRERLKRVTPVVDAPGVGYSFQESKSPFFHFAQNLLSAIGMDLEQAKRDHYLMMARAGLMSNDAIVYYLFFKRFVQPIFLVFGVLCFVQVATLEDAWMGDILPFVIGGGVLCLFGWKGANIYMNNLTQKRKAVLQRSFPDTLDLLLVCVEAGLPLDASLARVCREMKGTHTIMVEELERLRVELNVLNDRVQALTNLADRTDTQGFKTLVSTLIQTEKVGSSISDTLRVLADEYRTTRMLQAENKAARIPALITVPLIFFIMPAFMLIIMGPPVLKIMQGGGLFR